MHLDAAGTAAALGGEPGSSSVPLGFLKCETELRRARKGKFSATRRGSPSSSLPAPHSAQGPSLCLSRPLRIIGAQQNAAGTTNRKQRAREEGARSSHPPDAATYGSAQHGRRQTTTVKTQRCWQMFPSVSRSVGSVNGDEVFSIHFIFFVFGPSVSSRLCCVSISSAGV